MYPVHKGTVEKFGAPDERGTRWTYAGNLVGNGPFKLATWEINRAIEVERNTFYWGNDDVKLNKIIFA